MKVLRLQINHLRRCDEVVLRPQAGLNLLTGGNGAGKSSVLEALHLMAYGRSFRGRVRDGLIQTGMNAVEVFVEWQQDNPARHRRAGLRHTGASWEGRLDGGPVAHLGELCAALAVVTFEPGSHALVSGSGEPRRRYLDWGLFHVEPEFLPLWRRYARALKQRNALLKTRVGMDQLDAWDYELVDAGNWLTRQRERYLEQLQPYLAGIANEIIPSLGAARLVFQPGWARDSLSLADALLLARDRDLQAGHTSVGPHRADWRVDYASLPAREALSRGQTKLTALACLLAQAEHYASAHGEWPVMALDDLASELDRDHQRRVLQRLLAGGAQIVMTGTEVPPGLPELQAPFARFHVEQGRVNRV